MDFLDFSSYDAETWTTFLKENWLILVIALAALWLIVRIVKTVVKWAIVAAVVIGLILYSGYTLDDVKEIGAKVMDGAKQEAIQLLANSKDAEYKMNDDGTYTVKSESVELKGQAGASEVQVSLYGAPYITLELDGVIQAFIEQAKQNG
ncbi:hypothetical protein [Paenibacillus sp. PL2-23]|uniref:hypothetical protein n=1 Tax=Paenibacillus sp. PL2-23 TaxID=2100729 RepID=UPI0030F8E512